MIKCAEFFFLRAQNIYLNHCSSFAASFLVVIRRSSRRLSRSCRRLLHPVQVSVRSSLRFLLSAVSICLKHGWTQKWHSFDSNTMTNYMVHNGSIGNLKICSFLPVLFVKKVILCERKMKEKTQYRLFGSVSMRFVLWSSRQFVPQKQKYLRQKKTKIK